MTKEKEGDKMKKLKDKLKKIKSKRKTSLKISKKQKKPSYNFTNYKENKDIKIEIEKRYNILTFFVILALLILVISLFLVQIVGKEKYEKELENLTKTIIEGESAPRGRIYDRNGEIIVDNEAVKVIFYKKPSGIMSKNHLGIFSNKFIAGRIKEKNDAAIIIPALLPSAMETICWFSLLVK